MKGEGKAPTKAAAVYNAATKNPPAKKPPPKTIPLPRTVDRKYTNWKQEPAKSALACAVEAKLKGLDPQLTAWGIIIPDGTFQDNVRYAKYETKKRRVSSIIYLKYFARGETKTLTTELDRVYTQQSITLCDLKNN